MKIKAPVTTTFICDNCGKLILPEHHSRLEWLTRLDRSTDVYKSWGLRIVHGEPDGFCRYTRRDEKAMGGHIVDHYLSEFQDPDGLSQLLVFLEDNSFTPREVAEIIRRIHHPFYEEARQYSEQAMELGFTCDWAPLRHLSTAALARFLKYVHKHGLQPDAVAALSPQ